MIYYIFWKYQQVELEVKELICPIYFLFAQRSGSVVECLTRDRGAVGSSLTGVTALCT